ncbi:MAG: hypothetical protein HQL72_08995 [Magnetococcales bacterium]|nr:hypothetical protein [Magnetococcales bacterium]
MANNTETRVVNSARVRIDSGIRGIQTLRKAIQEHRNVEVEADNEITPRSGDILNSLTFIEQDFVQADEYLDFIAGP